MDFDKIPGNSHKEKELKPVTQMVSKPGTRKKKPFGEKVKEIIFGEDIEDVKEYVFFSIIVPAVKDTVLDILNDLLGRDGIRNRKYSGGTLSSISGTRVISYDKPKIGKVKVSGGKISFDQVVIQDRKEANDILEFMINRVTDFGLVSVADLYIAAGMRSTSTDNNYGWVDCSGWRITRVREGWLLDMPEPVNIM